MMIYRTFSLSQRQQKKLLQFIANAFNVRIIDNTLKKQKVLSNFKIYNRM